MRDSFRNGNFTYKINGITQHSLYIVTPIVTEIMQNIAQPHTV